MSRWRKIASPIVTRVLDETRGQSEKEIRAALREAYPFGPRSHHPYKIWLSEIKRQRHGDGSGPTSDALAKRIAEIRAHNASVGGPT